MAMAFLESAVVIYLRVIYYPNGFDFPLQPIDMSIAKVEILRELATIIMLIGAGYVACKNKLERFAWFLYCFAVWDIFYYVYLKLLIDWPMSWLTWDILFLIPVTWVGPVLSPIIVSLTMILLSAVIICQIRKGKTTINKLQWTGLIVGSLIIILSFITDYTEFILEHYSISELWSLQNKSALFDLSIQYIPQSFDWWIFGLGQGIILLITGGMYFSKSKYN